MQELSLKHVEARDSRGRPTVAVQLTLDGYTAYGDVPAGASKGEDEARTVSVQDAQRTIESEILPLLQRHSVRSFDGLRSAEEALIEGAGKNYSRWGANAVLPVSRALWQLAASLEGVPLAFYMRRYVPDLAAPGPVRFLFNIFNGGLHALRKDEGEVLGRDRIDIQEVMVVPVAASSYRQALEMGEKIDQALKSLLHEQFDAAAISRADEAGFSVKGLGDSTEAIRLVFESVRKAGFSPGDDVKLALDVAASSFFDANKGAYTFRGETVDSDAMIDYLVDFVERYPGQVFSIEDGLDENDWDGWKKLSAQMKKRDVVTIGDDLFVTQTPRLQKGIDNESAHAVLVKVNQNGSVWGTLQVMRQAREAGMTCVISHRSGETLDDSIADLAYATGALGLKTGDPQPEVDFPDSDTWVRRRKYLRMVELEELDKA